MPARPLLDGIRRFVILTRHFFGRLFQNELVRFEDQAKEVTIAVLALLAIFIAGSSEMMLFKYLLVDDLNTSWEDKYFIVTLVMVLFGLVAVVEWEVLFPDRQDWLNLGPLPVKVGTIVGAKLASFVLFTGLFGAGMSLGAAVVFPIHLSKYLSNSLLFFGWYILAHLLTATAACLFVLLACVALRFLLASLLPRSLYGPAARLVQFALITGLVFLLVAFVFGPGVIDSSLRSLPDLKERGSPILFRLPGMWFTGLYERLLGNPDPVFGRLATRALASLGLLLAVLVVASGLSYARHLRRTLEGRKGGRPSLVSYGTRPILHALALRDPAERAVYHFFGRTLSRSPRHRMRLTTIMAAASGATLIFVMSRRRSFADLTPFNAGLLALPLVFSTAFLAGLRSLANLPAWPDANWAFQVAEPARNIGLSTGFRKAVLLKVLVPFSILMAVVHGFLWDARDGALHGLFILVVSLALFDALFFSFRKVPFACLTTPGAFKLQNGVFYLVFFVLGLTFVSNVERSLFMQPALFPWFFGGAAAVIAAGRIAQRRLVLRGLRFVYEEEPEAALITLPQAE